MWRDALPTLAIAAPLLSLFYFLPSSNFFGQSGFVDKIGALTGSLTGFYIAGLLAVATFAAQSSALDTPIKVGPVFSSRGNVESKSGLTRREYVCYIFGYLAFLSLIISLISASLAGTSGSISKALSEIRLDILFATIDAHATSKILAQLLYLILSSHLLISSGYGMYYLIFKIYSKEAKLKQPRPSPRVRRLENDPE